MPLTNACTRCLRENIGDLYQLTDVSVWKGTTPGNRPGNYLNQGWTIGETNVAVASHNFNFFAGF